MYLSSVVSNYIINFFPKTKEILGPYLLLSIINHLIALVWDIQPLHQNIKCQKK